MPRIDTEKLKKLRSSKPLTQPELAEKMGLKRSTYAYKEKIGEFTDREIQDLVRILRITEDEILLERLDNGNTHIVSAINSNTPLDEIVKSKDETIATLKDQVAMLKEENNRLKREYESSLSGLNRYAQVVSSRVQVIMECHHLLRAVALQSKIDQKKLDASAEDIRKLYREILRETVEGETNRK